jgi:CBS domain-containing protein
MSLKENLSTEPVRRLNLRTPVLVKETTTVREAIVAMRAAQLGCAIVTDGQNKPTGMLTEAILREKLARGREFLDEPIADHAARKFPWVSLDDPVELVLDAMRSNNTRFICVVDQEQKVAGLTGQKGLMEFIAECFPRQVVVQRVGGDEYAEQREGA